MTSYDDDLRLAHVLADALERVTVSPARGARSAPADAVVDVVRAAEEQMVHQLARSRPRDGVDAGSCTAEGKGTRRWLVEAVWGVDNHRRGIPVWATAIALVDEVPGTTDGGSYDEHGRLCSEPSGTVQPVVGVVAAPALGRRWWAARGTGAWAGRSLSAATRITVSDVADLGRAGLGHCGTRSWPAASRPALHALEDACGRSRGWGEFWMFVLVADAGLDVAIEPVAQPRRLAALAPIVTEAGGRFTSLSGRNGPWGGSGIATNGRLHDDVLSRLAPAPSCTAAATGDAAAPDTAAPGGGQGTRGRHLHAAPDAEDAPDRSDPDPGDSGPGDPDLDPDPGDSDQQAPVLVEVLLPLDATGPAGGGR